MDIDPGLYQGRNNSTHRDSIRLGLTYSTKEEIIQHMEIAHEEKGLATYASRYWRPYCTIGLENQS